MKLTTKHILYPTPLLDLSPEQLNQINQLKLQSKKPSKCGQQETVVAEWGLHKMDAKMR